MFRIKMQRDDGLTFAYTAGEYGDILDWFERQCQYTTPIRRVSVYDDEGLIEAPEIQEIWEASQEETD